ncbi:MAG TPA: chorismate mutase, partial [Pirellulales bacterium]|nr:chorismate mutase [Pirellulales bacterium]
MAKEASSGKKPAAPSAAALRHEIDRADRELLKLLNTRAVLTNKLCQASEADGSAGSVCEFQPVLAKVAEGNRGPLSNECVQSIYRELLSGARALERHQRVAFLGPFYSFSHLAALERFGSSIEQVPVASIAAVFEEVNRGHVD